MHLHDGDHDDAAVQNELLYTTIRGDDRDAVHVYSTKTWQRISVIDIQCAEPKHLHTLGVNEQCVFISCRDTHRIYQMSLDGILSDTYGKQGIGMGEFACPFACMSDCDDNLLVADLWNNRLQLRRGRQWSVLKLQPPPSWPLNAVYDGNALYVVQWGPYALMKYE